ncbi:NADPH-dependent assimilatory sulfite reductase hemoprotein subunit [Hyphomicrobium sp.]|uniref:NADPH-dependent assimilatory sulfite reductase hemoprotein subunit n=1 Tax=Hyphomicrobium sp. TaxID=82 RepID=UPI002D7A1302|nr:NADPH-dependent assimilatory sulfite reductase hemoprotein subunit [Hyphomicrobium sp.]HET6387913.1 NADPH-dependent assimilatory sulfite reductase hemoprotein subunit [Hyphomicrobium sp.]
MTDKRSKNEIIKEHSHQLRGTLAEGLLKVETGAIAEDDQQLIKFHGSYIQDDRDVRGERGKKKLEKAYSFMIRLRIPGGVVTAKQWIGLDTIASTYANGTMRLTTRETFQFHGVIKSNLKRTMQSFHNICLDTLAACGDVNRNVMTAANPYLSKAHQKAYDLGKAISEHLLPRTGAYHEIWLEGEKVEDASRPAKKDEEPIYGVHYLPRKFKVVVAVPPDNDVDIYAHDLGFIAVVEKGEVVGWNVTVGGGMGMTHGDVNTFPRTADLLGFCTPEQAIAVAEQVVTVQRDWGNRENRARARLKYTIEDRGLDNFRDEVEKRLGFKLGAPRPFTFTGTGDKIGWRQTLDAKKASEKMWHLTLFVENGRIKDKPGYALRSALREIAELGICSFVCTANQNVILANVNAKAKAKIEAIFAAHGVSLDVSSGLRRNAMSCVALPTCGLALAEAERFLPDLVTALEESLDRAGLNDDDIVIRMTGCPNGCARPYLAEIGLVGRNPGLYNLYLGAAFNGSRLSKLYAQDVDKQRIVSLLEPLFISYSKEREDGEHFGDFAIRSGVVAPTPAGNQFHADVKLV